MLTINELISATGGRLISGKKSLGVGGISIDSRTIKPGQAFLAIKGDRFDGHDFIQGAVKKGASCIIREKRLASSAESSHKCRLKEGSKEETAFIEVKDTKIALGDIARFQRSKFNIPLIAVTGSNGKTTTKEMLAWILSKKYRVLKNEGTQNNHIGVPLALFNLDDSYDIAVLEIGTSRFGEIGYLSGICRPNIGIITNIGPSHLENLLSLEGVFKEKCALIKDLNRPCIGILNADDNLLRIKTEATGRKNTVFSFGVDRQADFSATHVSISASHLQFRVRQKYKFTLHTPGYYNIYNALAAIAVARLFGMGYRDIISGLAAFDFPRGRLKLLKLNKATFIDDTYNSNPGSLRQALESLKNLKLKGRKIFVMGDMLELGRNRKLFHYQAGKDAAGACQVFVAVGKLSALAARAARDSGLDKRSIFTCASSLEARDILFNKIAPAECDIVLVKGSRLMKMEEVLK